jgi:predicted MFS family arabinose efflux permease
VERWNKRKTVIVFQALMSLQAFGLAYLSYTGKMQMWQIIFLAFFYGSMVAVEVTARQSMLIELTGREALQSAIALQTTAFNVGRVLGTSVRRLDHCRDRRRVRSFLGEWSQLPVRDRRTAHCTDPL